MPNFATYSLLEALTPPLQARASLSKQAEAIDGKTVFLSHSSKDNAHILGAAALLGNHGASVYVDIGDNRLPSPPSLVTAAVLRDTVQRIPHFVLLVSTNSKGSIWMPWELGLADGYKGAARIAVLPVAQTSHDQTWAEQEYLGLYPRIVWGKLEGRPEDVWMVYNHHDNTGTALEMWLRGY